MVKVGIVKTQYYYPITPPYFPSEDYPEYPFNEINRSENNYVYKAIRELFHSLGYDKENYGTKNWNPFGNIIKPGMNVVIKPNFVLSRHFENKDIYSIITHPAILKTLIDYCYIALKGKGKIIIADAPQFNCNFKELIEITKINKVLDFYASKNIKVELYDLRNYWSKSLHLPSCRRKLPGDPNGYIKINLGKQSAYFNHPNPKKFYGAVYHRNETIENHTKEKQIYEISKTILDCDVFISVPKLKVHKKVGVTLNGKGLVGIATNKNLIVHYTLGSPKEGGDQYPDNFFNPFEEKIIKFERFMYDTFLAKNSIFWEIPHRFIYGFLYLKVFRPLGLKIPEEKKMLDTGNWYGNDTAWRMVVDLMKIIHFADKDGNIKNNFQRKFFTVIDGIIGGENKGPLVPDPKKAGILVGSENLLAADLVATRLMGFDLKKIKQFSYIIENCLKKFGLNNLDEIKIISNQKEYESCLNNKKDKFLNFKPFAGWEGYIEIKNLK